MGSPLNKPTPARRSLKRLVSRLAYCVRHDAHWYFVSPYGIRSHVACVLDSLIGIATSTIGLVNSMLVLVLRPMVSPLHWLWHSTVNADKIDELIKAKSANKKAQ